MSSKLVRKQLSAFIAEQSKDGQKALAVKEKKAEKKRASALKKKVKELQKEAQAKKSAKLVLKKNTQYFQTTKAASEQNTELQLKLLAAAPLCRSAAGGGAGPASGAGTAFGDPNSLMGMLMAYAVQMQQQQAAGGGAAAPGAEVRVEGLTFHPPGAEQPLLQDISMQLPANSLGLVMGRSGSGKTTLLQVLAGLSEQTSGQVRVLRGGAVGGVALPPTNSYAAGGNGAGNGAHAAAAAAGGPAGLTMEERMQQVGLVFQFPERHFLGEDLLQELTFTWPRLPGYWGERNELSARMQIVLEAVGLEDIPLHVPPWALSGGQQRRLALAIQLVRQPALLLLDEPLAGLDWTSRQEVVTILRKLKEQCTLLVVSHDLAEIAPLVDVAWRMRIGGSCEPVTWPPADLAGLEQ
ncbi:hypothetical protein HXX76_006987 [Chlamydomonas incerta]|uniref:ABC transporter domain-containing protein n=1 Tax=Chlamydomonas incerta TaxID=51695 RepID=A0A835W4S1_CHLIN|nr:hypothetical protein HXX76_006987 [Chlamydomonas incerta]|eukprot:KAG2435791.1 hypothetical protein HXX76_006987 [Chlamydomonas incerta]